MKNYPNQASSFWRLRGTLGVIEDLHARGLDPADDGILGYESARAGVYTFRGLTGGSSDKLEARILVELQKTNGNQGARTFARELRRTLRDMGWVAETGRLTDTGRALLASQAESIEEQAILVEGLFSIQVGGGEGGRSNRPVRTLLQLLAHKPSMMRAGLELALEAGDDGEDELARVLRLYDMTVPERMAELRITEFQRANAVKIFPTLAEYAGLVLEERGLWSLSQDGWRMLGLPESAPAVQAAEAIRRRRGRRTTTGRLVTYATAGQRRATRPPRGLSIQEQERAYQRLSDRTDLHQALVRRIWLLIGEGRGKVFEDEFSYDLLWLPVVPDQPATLFEMKSVTSDTDAYARVRHAVGQLLYYEYFNVAPALDRQQIRKVAAFDSDIPGPLVDFLTMTGIGGIVFKKDEEVVALNPLGQDLLESLQ